jgi:toxin ParE1/3/4
MKVVVRETAHADLEQIFAWIAKNNPRAAAKTVREIYYAIERLDILGNVGRKGRARDTCEWIVRGRPYVVVYELDALRELVKVVGVTHTARNRD